MRIRIYLLLCIALLTGDCIHGSARSKDGILVISSYSPLKENGNHVIASLVARSGKKPTGTCSSNTWIVKIRPNWRSGNHG